MKISKKLTPGSNDIENGPSGSVKGPKISIVPRTRPSDQVVSVFESGTIGHITKVGSSTLKHYMQDTPANCGPLAIINGVNALVAYHSHFNLSQGFPKTASTIRSLLKDNFNLRIEIGGARDGNLVAQNSFPLSGSHIYNLLIYLSRFSNIQILGDRFNSVLSNLGFPDRDISTLLSEADRIITCSDYHYISYVRRGGKIFKCVDSMCNPYDISEEQLRQKLPHSFIAVKVV